MKFPLSVQCACVRRELERRKRVYPALVEQRKMSTDQEQREIAQMEAVLQTLKQILIHASVFKRFSPKSFLELCGIDIAEARAHCAHLVKLGKLERLPDLDDCWYRAIREVRSATTPTAGMS